MKYLLLLLLIIFCLACHNQNSTMTINDINKYLVSDLNQFYMTQLNSHQILLLGESKHNDHVANDAVIEFLNYWLDGIEKGQNKPSKITLVLEYTQSFGDQLNAFFASDDVTQLGIEIQGRTLNTLKFFYDLKKTSQRSNQLKEHHNLEFEILCPEQNITFDLPRKEHTRIAKTERDNNTTRNILNYIKQNPDHKLIAFYGGGHIAKKERREYPVTPWGLQVKDNGIDTYTISLNHFGDPLPYALPFDQVENDFAVTYLTLKELLPKLRFTVDAEVFYKEPFFQTITLKDVPSVLVVQKTLEYAKKSPHFMPALVSLWHRYTGEDVSNVTDISRHVEENLNTINTIRCIESLSLFDNLFAQFENQKSSRPEIDRQLFDITCFGNVLSRKPYPLSPDQTAEELWRGVINDYRDEIKASLYTSLLFYGTAREKTQAVSKLTELTQKEFLSPAEWLQYSRELWNSKL